MITECIISLKEATVDVQCIILFKVMTGVIDVWGGTHGGQNILNSLLFPRPPLLSSKDELKACKTGILPAYRLCKLVFFYCLRKVWENWCEL